MRKHHVISAVVLLALLGAPRAEAQPFGRPLTPEQVACEERQMGRLLHRMGIANGETGLFLWRSAANGGAYRGLASTSELFNTTIQGDRAHKEKQMAFDLVLRGDEDFLNPQRERRPQATLVRRDTASNLDSPGSTTYSLQIHLELSREAPDPFHPKINLLLNTLQQPNTAQVDRAGRGIEVDDLLTPCHTEVTDFDLKVYSILARTVRPTGCLAEPIPNPVCGFISFKTAFYRAEEPLTYRVDVYQSALSCDENGVCVFDDGQIPLLLRLHADSEGHLTGGDLSALPFCTADGQPGCNSFPSPWMGVYVLPPLRPGVEVQGEEIFRRAAHLNIFGRGSDEFNVLQADVNWADLLKDTSWNGGLQP